MATKDGKKIGLALSGGGYRAAGYHLGVLKKLHDFDILRHIDVISTVSGGSIIGAYYVANFANEYVNAKDSHGRAATFSKFEQEFIKILKINFEKIFFRRWFNPFKLIRIMVSTDYSRTNVAADVYEEMLFANCGKLLNELPARPKLIINAANMNTGEIWKFSKNLMGSKPDLEVILDNFTSYRLASAVAASAAFPGAFPPLEIELEKYYTDRGKGELKLQDGGVIDNIGLSSILDEKEGSGTGCTYIIASDGGAPFEVKSKFSSIIPNVLWRVVDILMEQARQLSMAKVLNEKLSDDSIVEEVGMLVIDERHKKTPAPGDKPHTWTDLKVREVSTISTRLRGLGDRELSLLTERGYFLAERRIEKYMQGMLSSLKG